MADEDTTAKAKESAPVKYWIGEISAARAREKDFRKEGRRVLEIYNGMKKDSTPFNILYSNTETLMPALYNNQPRPVVQRRFKDEDPLGKAASMAGQRTLEYLVDTNSDEYASFDDIMVDAVLDALLPGRGATRVKYDAETGEDSGYSQVTDETVCYESLKWDRWTFGYAKKWKRVPWVSMEHDVTRKEATKLFGAEKANQLKYTADNGKDEDKDSGLPKDVNSEEEDTKTCRIHEIWDKAGGKVVRFIAECYKEDYLKVDEDPLELTGFYPIPEPIRFLRKSNDLCPTAIYVLYENQAKELNRITVRINKIVEAIKVRGVYDSSLEGEVADLLKKDDNALVPALNVAALQDGGLDKAIWLMPIEKLVTVLQQLYVAREQCKRVIYEITGISDILRGASQASETLGAQEIKQQWATLRLKRLQKEVARYARDLMRISLEIAGKHFQATTFAKITGLPYPTAQQKQAAAGQLAAARATGQPPDPKVLQTFQMLSWDEVLNALRSDTQRQYRIDIETNSTVDLDATEDRKNISELMTAMGQFLSGVTPLVEAGSLPFEAAQAMLLTITRRFQFGSEIEDQIKTMKQPQPKDDGKMAAEQAKNQLAQQQAAHDAQMEKAKMEQERVKQTAEQQLEIIKFKFEQQAAAQAEERSTRVELAKIEAQKALELAKLSSQRATEELKLKYAKETAEMEAQIQADTQIRVAEISAQASQQAAETSAAASKEVAATSADATIKSAPKPEPKDDKTAEMLKEVKELLSTPAVVVRDSKGKVIEIGRKVASK